MNTATLAFLVSQLVERIRDYPAEARRELFLAMDRIEAAYGLQYKLTDEERRAIEEGEAQLDRGDFVTFEEVRQKLGLTASDMDAPGIEAMSEAVSRIQNLPGEEQGAIADVLFALLDEYLEEY